LTKPQVAAGGISHDKDMVTLRNYIQILPQIFHAFAKKTQKTPHREIEPRQEAARGDALMKKKTKAIAARTAGDLAEVLGLERADGIEIAVRGG
jgi:hypothetical protein